MNCLERAFSDCFIQTCPNTGSLTVQASELSRSAMVVSIGAALACSRCSPLLNSLDAHCLSTCELLKGHRSSITVEGPGTEWVMQRREPVRGY